MRSFTLIEILVVVGIIIVLFVALPSIVEMSADAEVKQTKTILSGMMKTSRQQSISSSYGVVFYIDPNRQYQAFAFINIKPPLTGETWPKVGHRYEIVQPVSEFMENARIAPVEVVNWSEMQIANNNYQDNVHRNFFAIIFQDGELYLSTPCVLYDFDRDKNGYGDVTHLRVGENNVVVDSKNKELQWNLSRGVVIYDGSDFNLFPIKRDFLLNNHIGFVLNSFGEIVNLER